MLYSQAFTCVKCGKGFTKMVGGIVMTPKEQELMTRPICDKCKFNAIMDIFNSKMRQKGGMFDLD